MASGVSTSMVHRGDDVSHGDRGIHRLQLVQARHEDQRQAHPRQRGADDGLDRQPLQDASAANIEARLVIHRDGSSWGYCWCAESCLELEEWMHVELERTKTY
ncbi:uncharacterized protein LOC125510990 isoform X2 [Triticum urartu]|uniref:uncharacterized protein LOC125510990 isoform X2 n=1 Tax=Triticum urartu TaxID=4572 RepID=UPI002043852F|nr:uncharacterized protein LOC125510990 isoform X2 [Triticum urartu]